MDRTTPHPTTTHTPHPPTPTPAPRLKLSYRKDSWLPGDAPLCSDPTSISAELDKGLSPETLFSFVLRPSSSLFCLKSSQGRRHARTDLRGDPSKQCHKLRVFSAMYLSLRKRDFFCPNRKHVKSAGLLLFWRIWRARCFPWDSVSKSTNWHLPEQGEMESALSPSVLSRAPKVPAVPDCTQCPLVVTPGGRRGRKKGHVVRAVGCLTAAGLLKLFFWELLVHLAFKYSLCFSFFFFLRDEREANFPQC